MIVDTAHQSSTKVVHIMAISPKRLSAAYHEIKIMGIWGAAGRAAVGSLPSGA